MEYTDAQKAQILSYAHAYIADQFDWACRHGEIESFIEKYDIPPLDAQPMIVTRDMKILVVGDIHGRENDYIKAAKEYGLSERNLEFVGYDKIKKFNIAQLEYYNKYSDIICGPIPHKIKGLNGSNSLIGFLENADDKEAYPKLIKAIPEQNSGKPKLTISTFKKALLQTRLIKELQYDD